MENGPEILTLILPEGAPQRLDKALAAAVPEGAGLSRSRLQALILSGAVRVDGAVVRDAKARVSGGAAVITLPPPAPASAAAEDIPLDIRYEDDALIVLFKPAGLVVHPAPGAPDGTLVNALLHHCGGRLAGIGGEERPGIVHRIDKDTSGLLVVAKTDAAQQGLARQFAAHMVERAYMAVCWGCPDRGNARLAGVTGVRFEADGTLVIDAPIGRHRADRKKMAVRPDGGRRAVTRVTVSERFGADGRPAAALLSCRLETGRTHQIRVHLSHVGHPLLGDPVYGSGRRPAALGADVARAVSGLRGQALHAATLGFVHPLSGEKLRFEAEPPAEFNILLSTLRETTA